MTNYVGKIASRSRAKKVNQECEMKNWNLKIAEVVECKRSMQNILIATVSSKYIDQTFNHAFSEFR